jgi:hypothetical protein
MVRAEGGTALEVTPVSTASLVLLPLLQGLHTNSFWPSTANLART